jgi:hypothetical protein
VGTEDTSWRIDRSIDTDFFAKTWLESRSIVSFCNVNRRVEVVVVTTVWSLYFDSSLSVFFTAWYLNLRFMVMKVRTMDMRKLYVDFCP